ncbi:DUF3017 domain-containing protein [Streptomyces sp. CB03234]|uniref:DUF3017 domain-containing protein n=1 Tax=Streptomyces sp. (strain CB03234) TaxID=1703937 RepID=UPI0009A1D6F9|nr:DUF3017 domain-containing protein [Streptomyces sp. CB03234]
MGVRANDDSATPRVSGGGPPAAESSGGHRSAGSPGPDADPARKPAAAPATGLVGDRPLAAEPARAAGRDATGDPATGDPATGPVGPVATAAARPAAEPADARAAARPAKGSAAHSADGPAAESADPAAPAGADEPRAAARPAEGSAARPAEGHAAGPAADRSAGRAVAGPADAGEAVRPVRASRRPPTVTRDTARPEGGGRAAPGDAPAPARQWPLLTVLGLTALGLLVVGFDPFPQAPRIGAMLIGVALLTGAAMRRVLPSVGMLAVRSRFTDMAAYGVLGASIVLLSLMTQPDPWLEIPFLEDAVRFAVR